MVLFVREFQCQSTFFFFFHFMKVYNSFISCGITFSVTSTVIILKLQQNGLTIELPVQKMQTEWQTV